MLAPPRAVSGRAGYFVVPAYFVFSVQHAAYKFLKFMRIWAMRAPFQKVLAIPLHG